VAKRKPKHVTVYLGWDGSWVLSRHPLKVCGKDDDNPFLATGHRYSVVDIQEYEGRPLFRGLKLKKYETVRLRIEVIRGQ